MTISTKNKLIVITGGTRGIGKAIVEVFLANGFDVVTCARNSSSLQNLKDEMAQRYPENEVHVHPADLSRKSAVKGFAEFIENLQRPVEVLVNNSGVFVPGKIHDEKDGGLEMMIETNLYSAYHLTRALIGDMIKQQRGDIYNICSVASIMAYPNGGSYGISKFALLGFTKNLREELKSTGIRVCGVIAGATYTDSWKGINLPETRFIRTEDIAAAIFSAYALSRESVLEEIVIRPQLGDI